MSIESDLKARLSDYAGLTALVSTRVYPGYLPQKPSFPAIAYRRVSAERIRAMGADTGTVRARFQFDIWARKYLDARNVADQLRRALQRYSGTNSVVIEDIYFLNEVDFYEDQTELHHVACDFEVVYQE